MSQARRKFNPGYNYYVPAMQAGGDLGQALNGRFDYGVLVAADPDGILDAESIAEAGEATVFEDAYNDNTEDGPMGPYGRNVTVLASGAATSSVTVIGTDYLGQKMRETLTLNGTNSVVGLKAFKHIDRVEFSGTGATTIDLGWGTRFGLPYVTMTVPNVYVNNVREAIGTFTPPVFTDPQTATTGDPRGTIVFTTAPNGERDYSIDAEFTNDVNEAQNGGLHGIRQFFA